MRRRLRGIALSVITTCIILGGYAAEMPVARDNASAQDGLANDISASLVICGRGGKLISSFGHCSIHMSCPSAGLDNYYTYLIEASSANIRRFFAEGVCTGLFVVQKWDEFSKDYVEQNRPVTEYGLNLTTDEVRRLWMSLDKETYRPDSRTYSFLHAQCTSICADIIRGSLMGERIEYGDLPQGLTGSLRDYAAFSVRNYPWYSFCFQSLLGAEGEQQGDLWEKLAPMDIVTAWSEASIVDAAGHRRPVLTGDERVLYAGSYQPSPPSPFTPTLFFALLLAATLLLTLAFGLGVRGERLGFACDAILLCLQTLLGLFFTWLLLFSKAPWMPGNLLPIVFNPIPFVVWLFLRGKKAIRWAYAVYAVVLAAMMVAAAFVPQLGWAHVLLFATFLVRVTAHLLKSGKKSQQ